jgi:hypothetical protein
MYALVLGLFVFTPPKALALGRDLPADVLAQQGPNCVHGFMVNWTDTFFFAGDTAAFNKFVEGYSKRNDLKLRVVLHVGTKKARSPWDTADRDIPVDWSYHVWNVTPDPSNPAPSKVDVWLGGRIKLDELRIPANVEVVSGGEIDNFIRERQKK